LDDLVGYGRTGEISNHNKQLLSKCKWNHYCLWYHWPWKFRKCRSLVRWNEQVTVDLYRSINQKVSCILVGNKSDLNVKRVVSFEEGQALGSSIKIQRVDISCNFGRQVPKLPRMWSSCLRDWLSRWLNREKEVSQVENDHHFLLNRLVKNNTASVAKIDGICSNIVKYITNYSELAKISSSVVVADETTSINKYFLWYLIMNSKMYDVECDGDHSLVPPLPWVHPNSHSSFSVFSLTISLLTLWLIATVELTIWQRLLIHSSSRFFWFSFSSNNWIENS